MPKKAMWMVRSGRHGSLYDLFKERNVVVIGWSEIGSLAKLTTRDEMLARVAEEWPGKKEGAIAMTAGQLHRFRSEVRVGDGVVTYNSQQRVYLVGEIAGDYRHDPSLHERMPNVRAVKWRGEVDRDKLSVATRNTLGSTLTLFLLPEEARADIEDALAGRKPAAAEEEPEESADETDLLADIQARAVEFIKDRIIKLDWEEAQELVAGLLRAMGYKTQVSPAGPDQGKDIVASPDGFGFESPRIVVEVKHRAKDAIGSQQIRSFLGGRHSQDRGLYVSTGGFSKDAKYEAERAAIPLQLMDLDLLVQAILANYEKFDAETQRVLPLTRVLWPK